MMKETRERLTGCRHRTRCDRTAERRSGCGGLSGIFPSLLVNLSREWKYPAQSFQRSRIWLTVFARTFHLVIRGLL